MRELFLVESESTSTSLVLRDDSGEEFFVEVTDALRKLSDAPADPTAEDSDTDSTVDVPQDAGSAATPLQPVDDATEESEPQQNEQDDDAAATDSEAESADKADDASESSDSPTSSTERPRLVPRQPHPLPEPDPLMTNPMTLRPAEIQNRVRAGATAAELAEEMGVAESRVEPFTHPVMLERNSMAEMAKKAHPLREDGPAKLTLWEILATAFAARGHSLSEAMWDARRSKGEPWIIRITWMAGLTENEAEWTLKQSMTSPATVEARNSVAADLTDPDFVQPVRSLTSIGRGSRYSRAIEADNVDGYAEIDDEPQGLRSIDGGEDGTTRTRDDIPVVRDGEGNADAAGNAGDERSDDSNEAGEDFLQNPDPQQRPAKRRRKAVTPHWEDVLLGVRANTKRPKK